DLFAGARFHAGGGDGVAGGEIVEIGGAHIAGGFAEILESLGFAALPAFGRAERALETEGVDVVVGAFDLDEAAEEGHRPLVAHRLDIAPASAGGEIVFEDFDRADGARPPPSGDVLALRERGPHQRAWRLEGAAEGDDGPVGRRLDYRFAHDAHPCCASVSSRASSWSMLSRAPVSIPEATMPSRASTESSRVKEV